MSDEIFKSNKTKETIDMTDVIDQVGLNAAKLCLRWIDGRNTFARVGMRVGPIPRLLGSHPIRHFTTVNTGCPPPRLTAGMPNCCAAESQRTPQSPIFGTTLSLIRYRNARTNSNHNPLTRTQHTRIRD